MAQTSLRDWGGLPRPGATKERFGDASLTLAPSSDGFYPSENANKAHYLGVDGAASKDIVDRMVQTYADAGVERFFVYLSPSGQAPLVASWLSERGLRATVEESVLARGVANTPDVGTDYELRQVGSDEMPLLVEALQRGLEIETVENIEATLRVVGSHSVVALDGARPIATGSLFAPAGSEIGYLGWACTDPEYRGRGLQTALIGERVALAGKLGCEFVTSVTYDFIGSSFGNLLRCGFVEAYRVPIYRWERDPSNHPEAWTPDSE